MRVFRDSDDPDDDPPRKPIDPHNLEGQADQLADEIADWLTEVVDEVDEGNDVGPASTATPTAPTTPTTGPTNGAPHPPTRHSAGPAPTANPPRSTRRVWRASAASYSVVVTATALAATGQPAPVTVPVVAYGLGWIAYLCWNAAHRPSPALALAALTERRAARAQRLPR